MKKGILLFIIAIILTTALKSQKYILINSVDAEDICIAIDKIQRISFNENNMFVKLTNNNEETVLLEDLLITFLNEEIKVEEPIKENIDVIVYANSDGEITIESPCDITKLTIFDINGRNLKTNGNLACNVCRIDVNFLKAGIYILKVETSKGIVSKKFIKNR